jgi:hypothetical protein
MNVVGCICLTVLFIKGSIFAPVRRLWPKLLTCPLCVGFWIGLVGSLTLSILRAVQSGVETAMGAYTLYVVLSSVESVWALLDDERKRPRQGP